MSKQDRYIQLTGWTESRSHESRMRHFWGMLREGGTIIKTVNISVTDYNALYRVVGEIKVSTDNNICLTTEEIIQTITDSKNKKTRPIKLLTAYLKNKYQFKVPNTLKEKLGQYLRYPTQTIYRVKFSLGCEGEAHDYYHEDSCYWGSYASSRDIIEGNGGGAVRIYNEENNLIARAWFVPYSGQELTEGLVLFNAYGTGDLQHIEQLGNIVSQALNVPLQNTNTRFNVENGEDHLIYINSNNTYFVGVIHRDFVRRVILDVHLEKPYIFKYRESLSEWCSYCEEYFSEDDVYYVGISNDSFVCEGCRDNNYTYLDFGNYSGIYVDNEDAVEIYHEGFWGHIYLEDANLVYDIEDNPLHIENSVRDEYGNFYNEDSDQYIEIYNGKIYPTDECIYDEISEEWKLCD